MGKTDLRSRLRRKSVEKVAEWRLVRFNKQVLSRARPQPGRQPVVFFNATTRLTGMSLNAAFAYLTACGLQISGEPVVYFACNAGLSRCVLGTNRDDHTKPPPCSDCIAQSGRLYAHAPTISFEYMQDGSLGRALNDLNIEALGNFEFPLPTGQDISEPIPLGMLGLPSLRWALRRHQLQDDEPTRFLMRKYILGTWRVATEFAHLLREIEPSATVIFNGVMYPEAAARWVAGKLGVRVVTHEVGFRPFSAFFTEGQATAYPIEIPADFELSPEQNARLEVYLQQRFQGKFSMAGIQFWPEMRGLDESFAQKAARFQQIVPVFTNVVYDTSQVHANTVFPQMFAWLDLVYGLIQEHPETLFVIRAHPDEMRAGKESQESVPDWIEKNQVDRLANAIFVGPTEYLSSYELIQRSKFVMVYNSSIGLEAALMGKAVLCGGKARYTTYPIVYFPDTPETYSRMADQFLESTGDIDIPPEFIQNARRFIYYQFFRASLPFDKYLEISPKAGYVQLKSFDWRQLSPDGSPTIKVLCDGILQGKPFLMEESA